MSNTILEFDSVNLSATDAYGESLRGITFALHAGECGLFVMGEKRGCLPLMDVASGLLEPGGGTIRIRGETWDDLSPDSAARTRYGIGRVFDQQAWLSNLDVDENITLAERHYTRRSMDEIRAEANVLAQRVGLAKLPATRPAWTSRHQLMLAQWVRALLGAPFLLLLERPTRDVSDAECVKLIEVINERRAAGLAVWWLTSDARVLNNAELSPTFRAHEIGGVWEIKS